MAQNNYCSLPRRILVMIYDGCLLTAVFMFATALALPLTGGKAFTSGNVFYSFYLLSIAYIYFIWQWRKGRQTLGMRAWHIYIEKMDNGKLTWQDLSVRFILACTSFAAFGGGFVWALFNKKRLTFHDQYSHTILKLKNPVSNTG